MGLIVWVVLKSQAFDVDVKIPKNFIKLEYEVP